MTSPHYSALDKAVALDPRGSSVVEACAGSGKTWLLVSRMIRLLLAGAKPSELLAITFTRKAAQEMTSRLYEWLQLMATAEDGELRKFLHDRAVPESDMDGLMPRARALLEVVLTAQPGPTVTTFHGWFLDLLKRAPLEAGLPWGAPLLEREKLLRDEVRDRLLSQWAAAPESAEGAALTALLEDIGESNLNSVLSHFLQSRPEWLAYTEDQANPVEFALTQVKNKLRADLDSDPVAAFWADDLMAARAERVASALEQGTDAERRKGLAIRQAVLNRDFDSLRKKILKADGGRHASKATKGLLAALAANAEVYLHDYEALENALETVSATQSEQRIWNLNRHGLLLGHACLQAYQQAKSERGVIDFADAEWLGCKLLESEEFAPALNLKLDARYRHLLLDEFQDTNPLQWRTLSTWLAEARAADADMTVFMVGDPKQAIYRFRRGEARVFAAAADFLQTHFSAARMANNNTRRLAPILVEAINPVFAGVDGFAAHESAEENLSLLGALRCLPVDAPDIDPAERPQALRNALVTPLPEAADKAVHEEAREFARLLKDEIIGKWSIREEATERPARPGDVMGLVRTRTHLKIYEQALEQAGIPYLTSRRGGLLHALEAQDIIALLETLLLPHADLKLAHVLKSPLFACSDDELLQIFRPGDRHGWDELLACASRPDRPDTLQRSAHLLSAWHAQTGVLPAHDLLDRIYFEGDVEARYAAAVPSAKRPQVAANLRAFMQLALTQDSGRYPSLGSFIRELKTLVDDSDAAPEEGIAGNGENAVRLLTIHGAKGLESPIVWLLCGNFANKGSSYDVLSPWPPAALRPLHFSLYGKKEDRGAFREAWFADEQTLNQREETNLLYVALTRAEQCLVVSGDAARDKEGGIRHPWLKRVCAAWESAGPASLPHAHAAEKEQAEPPLARMSAQAVGERLAQAAQSRAGAIGELFHACLECHAPPGSPRNLKALAVKLGIESAVLDDVETRARALIANDALKRFFDPGHYLRARNELAFIDASGQQQRIDRLVEFDTEAWVLDYKTGVAESDDDNALAMRHREQLQAYVRAAATLLPDKPVRAGILLGDGRLVQLPEENA